MVVLVLAYARNGVIGRDGDLPWRLPGDMAHFRDVTMGGTVVMGRRTWESIPAKFRPLPGRRNVVLSRRAGALEGAEVVGDLDAALAVEGDVFVIGGGTVYAEALPRAARVVATEIDAEVEGDTYFAPLDAGEWAVVASGAPVTENGFTYTIRTYERRA